MLDVLITIGLLLSTASQLRPFGSPVGPGEICLVVWIFLTLSREVTRLGPPLTSSLLKLLIFWLVFATGQCVGTMVGIGTGEQYDLVWFRHDIAAYIVAAAISCLIAVEFRACLRLRRVAWLLAMLGAAWLLLQVSLGWRLIDPGEFETWEWDRFRGLSTNSNQLALLCAVIGLLSLHLADTAHRSSDRIVALICMIVAIVVGRLTESDSFLLVLIVAGPTYVALKLWKWLMSPERRMSMRSASAWILVLALPLSVAYVTPFGSSVADESEEVIKGITRGGGGSETGETARLRVEIWKAAVHRAVGAGMLGLGPGPHLEIPAAIVAGRHNSTNDPKDVPRPEYGIVPNFEAHNTFLDLFIQGGLIALLSFGWLIATAIAVTRRAQLDGLTTLLCGLAVFSVFHLIVRHPIFWFAIAVCLVAAASARKAPMAQVGS